MALHVFASQSQSGCVGSADDDVWYSFTATNTTHIIEVTPTTLNNAVIQVFNNCGGASLGCENSTGGFSTESLNNQQLDRKRHILH